MKITRRVALATLASATAAAAVTRNAFSAELQAVRVGMINIIDDAPLHVAVKRGYFEAEGLNLQLSPISGGAAAIPGLLGGAFDIIDGNSVSTLLAVSQGLKLVVVAPSTNMKPGTDVPTMVGRKDENFKTPADFAGKVFAVNNRNNINWLYGRAWLLKNGIQPQPSSFKEVPFPQMLDAVVRKQVDGAFIVEPFQLAALATGKVKVIGSPFIDVQPSVDVGEYATTADYAAKNLPIIEKFDRALRRGIDWFNNNRHDAKLYELISSFTHIPLETVKHLDLPVRPMESSLEQHRKTAELMLAQGMISKPIDVSEVLLPISMKAK